MLRRSKATATPKVARRGPRLAPVLLTAAPWLALVAMAAVSIKRPAKEQPGLSVQQVMAPETFDALEPGRGRLAAAPHRIPPLGWKDVAWRTWREVSHDKLTVVAGGITFYSLLALFPALGVFVSLYGLFADVAQVQRQLFELAAIIPPDVVDILGDQMLRLARQRQSTLSAAFLISLLLSVWSANAGMKSLFDGLNVAYDETEKRNFFNRTALTYLFTGGGLLFATLVTLILVAVPIVLRRTGAEHFSGLWIPLRWLALFAVAALAFAVVYRYGPCRARARWRWVTPGAVFSAGFWLLGSLGFSWYVNNIAHFDVTYGSLGAVIGFMMWIWFSVVVVLVGAELNAEIEHQTALDSTTGAPRPMGERGAAMADTVGLAFSVRRTWSSVVGVGRRQAGHAVGWIRRKPSQPAKGG